jgi:hypothetical protein
MFFIFFFLRRKKICCDQGSIQQHRRLLFVIFPSLSLYVNEYRNSPHKNKEEIGSLSVDKHLTKHSFTFGDCRGECTVYLQARSSCGRLDNSICNIESAGFSADHRVNTSGSWQDRCVSNIEILDFPSFTTRSNCRCLWRNSHAARVNNVS